MKVRKVTPRTINQRARILSHRLTKSELIFLRRLAMANIVSFDFQVRIGFYVADFVFPTHMLIVEIDGSSHKGREEHDAARDRFLVAHGFTVWRIPNAHASQWPLKKILECQRAEGVEYHEALKRANTKHTDAVTRARGKKPPQRKSKEEFRERFVNQCVAITNKKQRAERERKEQWARERQMRDDMRMSGHLPRIIRNYLDT